MADNVRERCNEELRDAASVVSTNIISFLERIDSDEILEDFISILRTVSGNGKVKKQHVTKVCGTNSNEGCR